MPRYTDIDLLIDKVEETTWYHINKNGELVMGANSETDIPLYKHSDIKRVLAEAPITDVVPKSEVERLKQILNSYALQYGTVQDQQKVIDEAKQEVSKKIFKELIGPVNEFIRGDIDGWDFCVKIAKLNKKYTEGVTDERAD